MSPNTSAPDLNRREFLKIAAAATASLVLAVNFQDGGVISAQAVDQAKVPFTPNLWIAIHPDNRIQIWAHRSEMGTGIRTSLPMVVADELDADWDLVTIEQAPGDVAYGDQNTDGSRSVRRFLHVMRVAGASARMMLEVAAAQVWGVSISECKASNHKVLGPGGRQISYGALVGRARALSVPDAKDVRLKKMSEMRYVGKDDVRFYDLKDIVTGRANFGLDVPSEEALTAVIWRTPTLRGAITSFDAEEALKIPGVVKVFELPKWQGGAPAFQALGGIVVVAKDTWSALRGRMRLKVEWDQGPDKAVTWGTLRDQLLESVRLSGKVVRDVGNVDEAAKNAKAVVSAEYTTPLLSHAPMEPPCALAIANDYECTVWAPTQNPQAAKQALQGFLKLDPDDVIVNVTMLGGGFGRKSKPDFIVEAALVSKEMDGVPIRLLWTREDDLRHDYYHTCAALSVEAGVDASGMPVTWRQRSVFPPIGSTFNPAATEGSDGELGLGFTDLPYAIPNIRCEVGKASAPVRIGWFRSVAHVYHAFSECSFVDELAANAGMDAREYLLKLLGEARHVDMAGVKYGNHGESLEQYPVDTGRLRHVIDVVTARSGWVKRRQVAGQGFGLAAHRSFLSYCAVVAQVDVTNDGEVRIPRMDIALDAGIVVNPDRVRAQLEGACVFGASLALMGEINLREGAVAEGNFDTYQMLRMFDGPREIHTWLVPSEAPPGGVGEVGVPPVAPAICNAIFAATGKRIRDLPINKHDLSRE